MTENPGRLAVWFVAIEAPGRRAEWDCDSLGAPEPLNLFPVRRPSSGDMSRHIPVTAYSVKTGTHHELESMLEHELFRELDRRRDVVWLLAQPLVLHLPGHRIASHTPDLLSVHDDGAITLWDARPRERVDEQFQDNAALTRKAAAAIGWRYEVFHGAARVERLNTRWLHEARRPQPWHETQRAELMSILAGCAGSRDANVGDILRRDDPELTSTMWHLLWAGEITCDLTQPIRAATRLTWAPGSSISTEDIPADPREEAIPSR